MKTKVTEAQHTAFRRLPFELIPTGLQGVFTSPALPEGFDPNSASPAELVRHGLLWPRPGADADPRLREVWRRVFSRRWDPRKRIVPILRPQRGKTHYRRVRRRIEGNAFTDAQWSGGSLQGTWASCIGFWTVPTVSQPTEAQGQEGGWNSSSWVGIDGAYGENDVLQAGIEQKVDAQGNASYIAWFEWFGPGQPGGTIDDISNNKVVLGDTSPLSPSLASCNGNLYLAWKGDGNDNLNVMVSTDNGATFGNKTVSPETSDDAPALASDGRTLFIAWKGSGNDNLNVATVALDDGGSPTGLVNKVTLGDTSPVRPALAVLDGSLYLAWKGDGNDNLNVMVSTDGGASFGNKMVSPETSDNAPALGINDGILFIAWKGSGNDNLNVAAVDIDQSTGAPTGLSNKVTLGDTTPLPPVLAGMNGYLFLGWRGDGNENLNIMPSADDGQTFSGKMVSPETSDDAPALALHNGGLFVAWKGSGNDNLNVARADVTGFTVPPYVNQTNIPNFPVNPGDTIFCSVQYVGNQTAGQISLANETTGEHFSLTMAPPPGATFDGNSIEWIMEAPDGGLPVSALPSFTPVQFTTALGCGADGTTVGNPQNGDTWTIVDNSQNPPATLTSTTLGDFAVTITFTG